MIRCLIGSCVFVLALQSPALAQDYLLDLTIWKLAVKEGVEAPTSYSAVKKTGKVVHAVAIATQANKPFEIKVFQPSTDQSLTLNVKGEVLKKDGDKKPSFNIEVSYLAKTFKKGASTSTGQSLTENLQGANDSAVDWTLKGSGELHTEGHLLGLLQTPQGTWAMTLSSKR